MRTRNKASYSYDIVAAFARAWIGLSWPLSSAGRCIEPELHPGHIIAARALWGLRAALYWSRWWAIPYKPVGTGAAGGEQGPGE